MRRIKLTREEQAIEDAIDEFVPASKEEFKKIAEALARRRKDTVLNIRISSYDLKAIKQKTHKLGIKYQPFIAELLHRVAHG